MASRKKGQKKPKALTPPDLARCQAEVPNGHSFMTLGGRPGLERCKDKPVVVIEEVVPGVDGQRGSMALCIPCWAVALKQIGAHTFWARPIIEGKNGREAAPVR
jgi:hypothetical protein